MRFCAQCSRQTSRYEMLLPGVKRSDKNDRGGLCAACYQRHKRLSKTPAECAQCRNTRPIYAKGMCQYCYSLSRRALKPKSACLQCGRLSVIFARSICRSCYTNNRKRRGKYGLTSERYIKMTKDQRGLCAICDEPLKHNPHVDHDHATGMIRALLCYKCNVGLGSFRDSPEILRAAALYIEAHSKVSKIA